MNCKKRKREATDSVTHLVKIVAGEVFDEKMAEYEEEKGKPVAHNSWPTKNAGDPWTKEEEERLCEEWNDMICEMAKRHGRTYGAITARLKLNGFLY